MTIDAYTVVKRTIDNLVDAANETDKAEKDAAFENNRPFKSCISATSNTLIYNVEDPDLVIPMYSLLKYSDNYSMTLVSWWNYHRDKIYEFDENASDGKSFEYKTKIILLN